MHSRDAFVAIAFVVLCAACAASQTDSGTSANGGSPASAADIATAMKGAGLDVRDAGMVEQPFFAVPAHVGVVDEGDLQVYEFATAADAEKAAAQVAPNGMTIGTSSMHWMAPPHFFRKGRLVVNYLGSSEKALNQLRTLLGNQFAGQ